MKKNSSSGVITWLAGVVVASLIGFFCWYIWRQVGTKTEPQTVPDQKTQTAKTSSTQPNMPQYKEYSSSKISLSFTYPSSWALNENLSNTRNLGYEGQVSLISPNGLILNINPSYGGKGGGCEPDPSDTPHNTKACSTLEVISKEKVAARSNAPQEEDVYLLKTKYTSPRQNGVVPASVYGIQLSNNKAQISASEPLIGAWFNLGIVSNTNGKPSIETSISGIDLSSGGVLNSAEVMAAETVLRTVTAP